MNYSAQEGAQYAAAWGDYLRLGRDATPAEIKADILAYAVKLELGYRQRLAAASAIAAVVPTAPT
jgi:hypothetical protein